MNRTSPWTRIAITVVLDWRFVMAVAVLVLTLLLKQQTSREGTAPSGNYFNLNIHRQNSHQLEYGCPSEPVSSEPLCTSLMPGSVWSRSEYVSSLAVTHVSRLCVKGSSGITFR